MTKIDFQSIGSVDSVDEFGDDDRVLVITADGVRQTTRGAVLGSLGGADIIEWNPRESRVPVGIQPNPFRRTFMIGGPALDYISAPDIDNVTKVITKKTVAGGGLARASWTLNGSIPATGNHWLALHAECTDPSTVHRVYLGRHVVEEMVDSEPEDCYGIIEFTPTAIRVIRKDTGAVQQATVTYDIQKVLLQITPTEVTVFITGGFIFSMGVRGTDDLLIGGEIVSDAAVLQYLRVNNDDIATAPRTPDAGFIPLSMEDSVLPSNAYPADILFTRTASVFRDQNLRLNTFYLLGIDDSVVALVDERHVPTLSAHNRFAESIGFNQDYMLASNASTTYVGKRTDTSYVAYTSDRLTESTLFGKSFPVLDENVSTNLYGFGKAYGAMTRGWDNVGVGWVGGALTAFSNGNVLIGSDVGNELGACNYSVALGTFALKGTVAQIEESNIIGSDAGGGWLNPLNVLIKGNDVLGVQALSGGDVGNYNVAIGRQALKAFSGSPMGYKAEGNVAIGSMALKDRLGSQTNAVAIGIGAMLGAGIGTDNVAVGVRAGEDLAGNDNVAIGAEAMADAQSTMTQCTAVGHYTMLGLGATINSSAFGNEATVTGDNQVQLGNSLTTTFVYGAVQSRSDVRDKTGVRDTELGLDFVLSLRPVDYQWDYREDYLSPADAPQEPAPLAPEPIMPVIAKTDQRYDSFYTAHLVAHKEWRDARDFRELEMEEYRDQLVKWEKKFSLTGIVKDGGRKRKRYHHGFIAQEVKAVADEKGVDFGGYQDHSLNGGRDVRSLGYEEFIGPIVKSIQQLNGKFMGDELISQVADRVMEQIANNPDNPLFDIIAERMLAKLSASRRG